MAWQSLGNFTLTQDWQFTGLVTGEIFRIKHTPVLENLPRKPRAVIAQSFVDENGDLNIFDKRIIVYQTENDAFNFYFPKGVSSHSLAIKRLDDISVAWELSIEVFEPDSAQQALESSQFRELIALLSSPTVTSNMKQSLIPQSQSVQLQPGFTAQPLVPPNPNRAYLQVRAGGSPVYLWADVFDENESPQVILAEIDKGATFALPVVSDGIYKGGVYAQVTKSVAVDWTEYSYPEETP